MTEQRDISILLTTSFNNVPGDTFQEKLDHLSNCNCCDRHQINKPLAFFAWCELPFNNLRNYDNDNNCKCNCRHVARFICRQHDDYGICIETQETNDN
jgi:hypothetical protein